MQLSKLAAELEQAGNENDIPKIKRDTEKMLQMYEDLRPAVTETEEDSVVREKLTNDMWVDALNTLAEFAQLMDYENSVLVIGSLSKYEIPDESTQVLNDLKKMVEDLRWDEVTRCIGNLLQ